MYNLTMSTHRLLKQWFVLTAANIPCRDTAMLLKQLTAATCTNLTINDLDTIKHHKYMSSQRRYKFAEQLKDCRYIPGSNPGAGAVVFHGCTSCAPLNARIVAPLTRRRYSSSHFILITASMLMALALGLPAFTIHRLNTGTVESVVKG